MDITYNFLGILSAVRSYVEHKQSVASLGDLFADIYIYIYRTSDIKVTGIHNILPHGI